MCSVYVCHYKPIFCVLETDGTFAMNFMCHAELAKGQSAHLTEEHVMLVDCVQYKATINYRLLQMPSTNSY